MLTKDQKIEVVRARISVLETSIYNIETLLLGNLLDARLI